MLLGFTRPSCSGDLVSLQINGCSYKPEEMGVFAFSSSKTIPQGRGLRATNNTIDM